MNTQHTPGPWKFDVAGYGNVRAEPETGENICNFSRCWSQKGFEQQQANARLIAAAPELLEALQECVSDLADLCPPSSGFGTESVIAKAEAAIAKAKGAA